MSETTFADQYVNEELEMEKQIQEQIDRIDESEKIDDMNSIVEQTEIHPEIFDIDLDETGFNEIDESVEEEFEERKDSEKEDKEERLQKLQEEREAKEKQERLAKFSFKIGKTDIEQVFNSLNTLAEQITLEITNEGIVTRCMDPSHVALMDVRLPCEGFEKYEVEKEGKFAVVIDEISKVIKQFEKKDTITFELDSDSNMLRVFNREVTMKIRLIDSETTETPLPKIPYDCLVEVMTKSLIKKLQKIQTFSDYVTFETSEQKCVLSGKGDSGEINTEYEKGHVDLMDLHVKQDSESTYSLEYLIPMLKSVSSLPVQLEYSTGKPIRFTSKFANIHTIQFYLAPRVEC